LKLEAGLGARRSIEAELLIVDEASMMVFPHLLALASLTRPSARIMVAGDNRQLSPILSHAWDREDRPPTIHFQPFLSAYEVAARVRESVVGLPNANDLVSIDRLRHSFRLAPAHRALVGSLYRTHDDLELLGRIDHPGPDGTDTGHPIGGVWRDIHGLILILHDEQQSRKENAVERAIVGQILDAYPDAPPGSIVVLSPHRAQRGLLQESLGDRPAVAAIDTVERLQGGEAPTVIVSATASDPAQVRQAEEFLMSLNRSNVAFSRSARRLIIIASRTLVDHVAADLDVYEAAMLWKRARETCSRLVTELEVDGHRVQVFGTPVDG
jgi:superfamily I DNA and/or RNA helicase